MEVLSSSVGGHSRLPEGGACRRIDKLWVDEYAERIGRPVAPVGTARAEHLAVLLADDGRLLGGHDDELGELGDDILETIDRLAHGDQFKRRV